MSNNIVGLNKEKKLIKNAINAKHHVLLIGETGLGKTMLVKEFSIEQKINLHRVSLNGEIGLNEILGRWLVKDGTTFWQDGILVTAMKNGDWIVFDEINAALPEVLFCLNALLDDEAAIMLAEKDNEVVRAHNNFRFFATMNPSDSYVGTKDMNQALMSRFHLVICFKDYATNVELEIVKKHVTEVDEAIIETMIMGAKELRLLKNSGDIMAYCSTRDLINMSKVVLSNNNIRIDEVFELCFLNKMSREERDIAVRKLEKNTSMRFFKEPVTNGRFVAVEKVMRKLNIVQEEVARLEVLRDGLKTETVAKISQCVLSGQFDHVIGVDNKKMLKKKSEMTRIASDKDYRTVEVEESI